MNRLIYTTLIYVGLLFFVDINTDLIIGVLLSGTGHQVAQPHDRYMMMISRKLKLISRMSAKSRIVKRNMFEIRSV